MVKTNPAINETSTTVFIEDTTVKPVEEENFEYTNLNNALVEIRKTQGVTGYILKSSTAATIDLNEPSKLVDYALLTSGIIDSSQTIEKLFGTGNVESILIEGKTTKTLCIIKGENRISIFMEKTANHTDILKKIETKQAVSKTAP